VTCAATVIGTPVAMPVLVAPMAAMRLGHPEGEVAVARAAAGAGVPMLLSMMSSASPADVAAAGGDAPRWFQVYLMRDRGITDALVDQAVEHGFSALVLTVDAPRAGRRERDIRNGFTMPPDHELAAFTAALGRTAGLTVGEMSGQLDRAVTWSDVERLAERSGLPVIVKGVQHADDGRLAAEHGAAAVVVSNHGGRQLDTVPATADVLAGVVDAVAGRIEVLVDGGIRRGTDVCAALALGATAVLVGRPLLWALVAGGEPAVGLALELLRGELEIALTLLGCVSPAAVGREHLAGAQPDQP
jgi:isopentenyl diphosphate isomerase/L-lactate dehydrogenase-like FMN-dependent dehydrogenase